MFKDNPTPTVPPADVPDALPDALPELRAFIPLPRVPALLPPSPRGETYSLAAVYKAARAGVHGRKLRTVRVMGRLFTRAEWVREFAMGGAGPTAGPAAPSKPHGRADRELARAGW